MTRTRKATINIFAIASLVAGGCLALLLFFGKPRIAAAAEPQRNCVTGPLMRTFGGTPWLVYSCDDQSSIVIVTLPGSPAAPFVFSFMMSNGQYHLHGEGTGRKDLTDAAYSELSKLSAQDIELLVSQCQAAQAHNN